VPQTTDSTHEHPVAPNVLDRDFTATAPNQKWACDLTYLFTEEGWLYLSVVIDLFSRRVVGWSMSDDLKAAGVAAALQMAVARRRPPDVGLLHHSDRGVQYACHRYRQLLSAHGIACSMSRPGNCYDNACVESFFGTLKSELVHRTRYRTRAEARASVFEWIECWYNRRRRHSSLGYLSPESFEAQIN
jgi:transposase InsO family protein